jgi:hypothetical protein
MLELKIQCAGCDQKYKFDVEPVNGRMPWPVQCPICKADGTEVANSALASDSRLAPNPPPAPVRVSSGTIRIGAAPAAESVPQTMAPPSQLPQLAPPPAAQPALKRDAVSSAAPNFNLGVAGAIAGALVGMIGWYLLIRVVHHTIGYAAVGVGALAGFGARSLAKEGSHPLGIVAAVCAVIAILLGQFLAIRSVTSAAISDALGGAYDEHMVYAKEAIKAKSDEEIKAVLAKSDEKDSTNLVNFDAKAIQAFRQKELPTLQKFVNGVPGRAQYQEQQQSRIEEFVGPLILKESFSFFTLLWVFLGISGAYRVAKA